MRVCTGLFANNLLFVADYLNGMPGPRLLPAWRVNPLGLVMWNGTHVRTSINAGISLVDQLGFISWKNFLCGCTASNVECHYYHHLYICG